MKTYAKRSFKSIFGCKSNKFHLIFGACAQKCQIFIEVWLFRLTITVNLVVFKNHDFGSLLCSGVGRGEQRERPPPPKPKNVVEIWCYLPEYILPEQRQKSQKSFLKIMKKSIFHRDFAKNFKIFLKFFKKFKKIFGPNAQNFACRFHSFPCLMENIHKMLIILYFSPNYIQFSRKISRIFTSPLSPPSLLSSSI